jgi:hypothetical protein
VDVEKQKNNQPKNKNENKKQKVGDAVFILRRGCHGCAVGSDG